MRVQSKFAAAAMLAVVASLAVDSQAHDGEHKVAAVKPAEHYKPTAMPDRIVLTLIGDPRTTSAVTWRTSTEVTKALVEIAEAEASPYFSEKSKQIDATTEVLKTDLNEAHFHSVQFEGLKPGTKYAYRVGDGTNWSEWFHFKTAAATNEPFSFIYFGDAQNNVRSMWSRVIREAYSDAPKAAFLLHAGDLINTAESDGEWGEWFGAGAWLNAMVPNVAVPGNHEQGKDSAGNRRLSHHWRPSFTLPQNGPAGLEESCFTFTYHNMRFIGLNSNEKQAEQTTWLDQVLSENTAPWVVCSFHHPIYSTGKDRDNAELRSMWKPVFDKYKVDLVLTGHDHTYGRTGFEVPPAEYKRADDRQRLTAVSEKPQTTNVSVGTINVATGVQHVDASTGTVYVVSVSGPKMYNHNRQSFMKRVAEDTQLYQIIHIDGDKLRFEARTAIGQLYDAFELNKRAGQVNELVELKPEIEQRLRPTEPAEAEPVEAKAAAAKAAAAR